MFERCHQIARPLKPPLWHENLGHISPIQAELKPILCANSQLFVTVATGVGRGPIWMTSWNWPISKTPTSIQESVTCLLYSFISDFVFKHPNLCYALFPPFRCRSSVAVSPFCRCKIPLFCKNYVRKFRSVTEGRNGNGMVEIRHYGHISLIAVLPHCRSRPLTSLVHIAISVSLYAVTITITIRIINFYSAALQCCPGALNNVTCSKQKKQWKTELQWQQVVKQLGRQGMPVQTGRS